MAYKVNHYIPQFVLRNFSEDNDNKIKILDWSVYSLYSLLSNAIYSKSRSYFQYDNPGDRAPHRCSPIP